MQIWRSKPEPRVAKYNLGTRAVKYKVLVRTSKYIFGTRTGERGQEPARIARAKAKGREPENTRTLF